MKKLILIIAVTLFSLNCSSQEKINTDDLIGYWRTDQESTQLFFWKDINGELQVQEISATSGEPLDLIELKVNNNSVYIKTIFTPNDWTTENTFTFLNKNTLQCKVSGNITDIIMYKKIK